MDPPWPGMGFPDAGMGPPWPGVDFFGLEILALSLAWALLGPQRICEPSGGLDTCRRAAVWRGSASSMLTVEGRYPAGASPPNFDWGGDEFRWFKTTYPKF